jgi:hypothetical protein
MAVKDLFIIKLLFTQNSQKDMSGGGGTTSDCASSDKEKKIEEAVAATAARAAVEAATATSPPSGPAAAKVSKPSMNEAASAFSQSDDKHGQAVSPCSLAPARPKRQNY